jgi:hypothetical protein
MTINDAALMLNSEENGKVIRDNLSRELKIN